MPRRNFTAAEKQRIMEQHMASAQGRAAIAQSVVQPLRTYRDYQSVGRRAFMIDELPDGALPIYDKDPDIPAFVVGEEGNSIQTVVKSARILTPMFELASNPVIPITQIKERRFDVVKRIKEKSKVEIFRKEDRLIFKMMDVAATKNTANNINNNIVVSSVNFSMETLADAFANVEAHGLVVDKVYMNPAQFKVVRNAGRDYLDFETQREILRTGLQGLLWGAQVILSMEVPNGSIFLCTEPEYFGVMPIRVDLTILPADIPAARQLGWSVFQQTGVSITNPIGLQKIVVT